MNLKRYLLYSPHNEEVINSINITHGIMFLAIKLALMEYHSVRLCLVFLFPLLWVWGTLDKCFECGTNVFVSSAALPRRNDKCDGSDEQCDEKQREGKRKIKLYYYANMIKTQRKSKNAPFCWNVFSTPFPYREDLLILRHSQKLCQGWVIRSFVVNTDWLKAKIILIYSYYLSDSGCCLNH